MLLHQLLISPYHTPWCQQVPIYCWVNKESFPVGARPGVLNPRPSTRESAHITTWPLEAPAQCITLLVIIRLLIIRLLIIRLIIGFFYCFFFSIKDTYNEYFGKLLYCESFGAASSRFTSGTSLEK